ncbi:MAG: ABC transporter substrate-binding protein [bacterium]
MSCRLLARCLSAGLIALSAGCGAGQQRHEKPGEMVLYGATGRIRGFDPAKAGDVESAIAVGKVYEGLVQYSYLARPYRLESNLAEAMPEISDDGLTYTFRIRKGIFFQDDPCFTNSGGKGRELQADDFVYSIKRVADVKNESTGYWAFESRISGLDDFRKASSKSKVTDYGIPVGGLQAPDPYTFRITLTEPYPQLLWILSMGYAFAVPREAIEFYKDDFGSHPVGTGPYVLKTWRRNYMMEFVRSPKWAETGRIERYPAEGEPGDAEKGLLADAGKQVPFVDRIVQHVISDESTQWLKFVTGEIESSGISRDNWNAVVTQSRGLTDSLSRMKVRMFVAPTLDIYYIGFNMEDPVVGKNKKLRQALSCAFNTGEWIRYKKERCIRATGPIPPGVAGYEDKPSPYPFDLEKARKLLAEAGYPDGIDPSTGMKLKLVIEIGSAGEAEARESTELLANFVRKLGVELIPSYNHWPSFLSKMERRQCQLYKLGWVADYPDAQNFLQLFYGPNSSPGPNHSNYVNPEFDRLYVKVRTMPDSPERTAIYRQMADMVIEDCPWLFMDHPMSYGLHHHWVGNYKPHDFPYGMEKYRKIDTNARREWQETSGKRNWRE